MVDLILRLTVGAVLVLAVMNMVQAVALLVRLVRYVARRQPDWGLSLWLPTFASIADVRRWLDAWREALRPEDPALVEIRTTARTLGSRQVYLTVLSHSWAFALSAVAPHLV
jgi:hypothetical protein